MLVVLCITEIVRSHAAYAQAECNATVAQLFVVSFQQLSLKDIEVVCQAPLIVKKGHLLKTTTQHILARCYTFLQSPLL